MVCYYLLLIFVSIPLSLYILPYWVVWFVLVFVSGIEI